MVGMFAGLRHETELELSVSLLSLHGDTGILILGHSAKTPNWCNFPRMVLVDVCKG